MSLRNAPPASPTNTSYSGISNYRTDAYKPLRDAPGSGNVPPLPGQDGRQIARKHYEELTGFLANHMAKEPANARVGAREKLTRLTRQQFQELSTDVYDELVRRKTTTEKNPIPFLPVRDDFHPKRNQARQKLATLPRTRFKDLSSDVYVELGRRYPELKEPEVLSPNTPGSVYDEASSPEVTKPPPLQKPNGYKPSSLSLRQSEDRGNGSSAYPSPASNRRRPSEDRPPEQYARRGSPSLAVPEDQLTPTEGLAYRRGTSSPEDAGPSTREVPRRPSEESARSYGGGSVAGRRRPSQEVNNLRSTSSASSRRRPSQEANNLSTSNNRKPSGDSGYSQATSATAGVIIPNKSTIAEEDIQVPFGRRGAATSDDDDDLSPLSSRAPSRTSKRSSRGALRSSATLKSSPPKAVAPIPAKNPRAMFSDEDEDESDYQQQQSPLVSGGKSFGLGAIGATLMSPTPPTPVLVSEDDDYEAERDRDKGRGGGSDYFDKMSYGRASVASDVSGKGGTSDRGGGRAATRQSLEDIDKLRREYEFKIATMQSKITSLEASAAEVAKAQASSSSQMKEMEDEVDSLRDEATAQASKIRSLERELEEALTSRDREQQRADQSQKEIDRLNKQIISLENEQDANMGGADFEATEALREEVQGLLEALRDTSTRNEEMMADKDADMLLIQTLNTQLKEYKRKYEQAKTDLRNTKATSQFFGPQVPKVDARRMPLSDNGVIVDIHITNFQSAVDTLLSQARSDDPGSVLTAMKYVVTAVTAITDDIRAFERRPYRMDVNEESIRNLRERTEATLSNLVSVAKQYATSYGLAPVSLVDAAASHVSSAVIELVKLLQLRRSSPSEREAAAQDAPNMMRPSSSQTLQQQQQQPMYASLPRAVEETRTSNGQHMRTPSAGSYRGRDDMVNRQQQQPTPPPPPPAPQQAPMFSGTSDRSNSSTSPPPSQIFDNRDGLNSAQSNGSITADGGDEAWEELKPYLEVQSEQIVYSIQNLLAAIRRGAQVKELNEDLTQIVTIVSSIVAVCKDSLPPASASEGAEILRELSDQGDKLSEMQSLTEITKTTRQTMASSSFAIAKNMKELMKL